MNQKQNRLNAAGSHHRVLPEIARRHGASSMPNRGHAVVKRAG
ncbi:hypothetical protein [Ignatzschineria indica]|nr:hypothetical protein [Ignatzschineria indica]